MLVYSLPGVDPPLDHVGLSGDTWWWRSRWRGRRKTLQTRHPTPRGIPRRGLKKCTDSSFNKALSTLRLNWLGSWFFFAELAKPGAEAVEALSISGWDTFVLRHRETISTKPPSSQINKVAKTLPHCARALVFVPFSITAAYSQANFRVRAALFDHTVRGALYPPHT